MTLFEEIVNEALFINEANKSAIGDRISNDIANMYRVRVVYDDGEPRKGKRGRRGKNERNFFPMVYGKLNGSGNIAVAGYEAAGSTKRGLVKTEKDPQGNKWKVFLLKNIVSWTHSTNKFDETNITDAEAANNFNPNGDRRFSDIYAISPMVAGYDRNNLDNPNQPIGDKPITKKDVQPEKMKVSFQPKQVQPVEKEPVSTKTQTNTVDNNQENGYNDVKTIEAPDAKPVTKGEIENGEQTNVPTAEPTPMDARKDEPVTKDEIENPKNNAVTDLMRRMGEELSDENNEEEEEAY